MRQSLLTPSSRFGRSAIMRRAHARRKWWAAHGVEKPWGECLSDAWAVAKKEKADAATLAKAKRAFAGPNHFTPRERASCLDAAIAALAGKGRALEQRA